jgi:hypothetical protein
MNFRKFGAGRDRHCDGACNDVAGDSQRTKFQAVFMEPSVSFERRHRSLSKTASIFSCFNASFALINEWIGFVKMLGRGTESLSQRRIQYFVSVCQGVALYSPAGTLARCFHADL